MAGAWPWSATGWRVPGSNPGGGEIFRTCPDRHWGPPSLLYNGHRVNPAGASGRDVALISYWLEGPGINSRWWQDFPHLSRPTLAPTQSPVQRVPSLSRGGAKWPERDPNHPSPFSSEVKGAELYIYSRFGLHGLFYIRWPLPLFITVNILPKKGSYVISYRSQKELRLFPHTTFTGWYHNQEMLKIVWKYIYFTHRVHATCFGHSYGHLKGGALQRTDTPKYYTSFKTGVQI